VGGEGIFGRAGRVGTAGSPMNGLGYHKYGISTRQKSWPAEADLAGLRTRAYDQGAGRDLVHQRRGMARPACDNSTAWPANRARSVGRGLALALCYAGVRWQQEISRRKGAGGRYRAIWNGGCDRHVTRGEGSGSLVCRGPRRRSALMEHERQSVAERVDNAPSLSAIRAGRWHWAMRHG